MRYVVLSILVLAGCTKGGVWNAADLDRPVPATRIEVSEVAKPWSAQVVESADGLAWGRDNFAFGPRPTDASFAGEQLRSNRWHRFDLSRDGFESRVFYRYHPGYDQACENFSCPSGDGDCCHHEDFALWPVGTARPVAPDLIVDPNTLAEQTYIQCVDLGGEFGPEVVAVRTTVDVANIGDGALRLESARDGVVCGDERPCSAGFHCDDGTCEPDQCDSGKNACPGELVCRNGECAMPACFAGQECRSNRCGKEICEPEVVQRLDGVHGHPGERRPIETLLLDDGHELGALGFVSLRVMRPAAHCDGETARDCTLASSPRRVHCIEADDRFDPALDGDAPLTALNGCHATAQVLGRGQRVTYDHDIPGQVMILGSPSEAKIALSLPAVVVAEVDPTDMLVERDTPARGELVEERANNRATVRLRPLIDDDTPIDEVCQASVSSRCTDCVPLLDCSQCRAGKRDGVIHRCASAPNLTRAEEEMCGDYPPAIPMTKKVASRVADF